MTAKAIATAIVANCERYNSAVISYETWDAEQFRLWDLAGTSERKTARVHRMLRERAA